ncbi:zinc finger protein RFP-like [Lates japonicus]
MKKLFEAELKKVQQYAVDVTFDPDTAHSNLILCDDGQHDIYGDPESFDTCLCVLGKQVLSSGRFYYEAEVEEETEWYFGLFVKSPTKNGLMNLFPVSGLEHNEYTDEYVFPFRIRPPMKHGKLEVFVDYEESLISFNDVDAANHIHSFIGYSVTDRLHPFLIPFPSPLDNDTEQNNNLISCQKPFSAEEMTV